VKALLLNIVHSELEEGRRGKGTEPARESEGSE
jgi:hypothetical protein